jgi:membrane-associated phospholipid phosphatase
MLSTVRNTDAHFGKNWSAAWLSWVAVAEFAALKTPAKDGHEAVSTPVFASFTLPYPTKSAAHRAKAFAEIDEVLIPMAVAERPDALGEIIDQSDDFLQYFMGVLGITTSTHPATYRLMTIAGLIGLFTCMHYKKIYDFPRPSQVAPALMPPIAVPGTASYPSGHATQSFLIVAALGHVFPPVPKVPVTPDQKPRNYGPAGYLAAVEAMAERIARNREIAGLHFPTDTAGGRALAGQIAPYLPSVPQFRDAIRAARAEWAEQGVRSPTPRVPAEPAA